MVDLIYFLGLEIDKSSKDISLCQRKYCLDLLPDTDLLAAKTDSMPMDPSNNLHADVENYLPNLTPLPKLICKLIYLTHSLPDISYSVCKLNHLMSKLATTHFQSALQIAKYLKNSPTTYFFFPTSSNITLISFVDSKWGSYPITHRFITYFISFLSLPSSIGNEKNSW